MQGVNPSKTGYPEFTESHSLIEYFDLVIIRQYETAQYKEETHSQIPLREIKKVVQLSLFKQVHTFKLHMAQENHESEKKPQ